MRRRDLLAAGLAGVGATFLPRLSGRAQAVPPRHLVFVFLRGGADALGWFTPRGAGEQTLAGLRPTLSLASPQPFSPTLAANRFLAPMLGDATLMSGFNVVLHAGSVNETRSHFEQMAHIESGDSDGSTAGGFLAAAAEALHANSAALAAVMPASLRGTNAVCLTDPQQLQGGFADGAFRLGWNRASRMGLYRYSDPRVDPIATAALSQLDALSASLGNVTRDGLTAAGHYLASPHEFGQRLAVASAVLASSWNPAIVTVDAGHDWDTHFGEYSNDLTQWYGLAKKIDDVARNLVAFKNDLVARNLWASTVVAVVSEFGRTVKENGAAGTDHGRGGLMMLLGGRIRAHADTAYRGLRSYIIPATADSSTALDVVHDYRVVMAELLENHLGLARSTVLGLFRPAGAVDAADYLSVLR
jgi:uncharacterized protein (DUF1501 family)